MTSDSVHSKETRIPAIRAQVERWDARKPLPVPDVFSAGIIAHAGEYRAAVKMEDVYTVLIAALGEIEAEVDGYGAHDVDRGPPISRLANRVAFIARNAIAKAKTECGQ